MNLCSERPWDTERGERQRKRPPQAHLHPATAAGDHLRVHVSSNAVTVHVRDSESTAPFPPPADPTVSVADAEANEIDGKMTFVITMSRAKGSEGTKVGYTTSDGTAKAGEDYEKTSGYVTIRPGDTEATVDVALIDDAVPDDGETLGFGLNFLRQRRSATA